jgi:hypothetical protein
LERANEACQYISDYAYERPRLRATTPTSDHAYESGTRSKHTLQEAVHHEVRERLDLAAQMAIRAHAQVADQRRGWINKPATKLAREYDLIVCETLTVQNM